MGSNSIQRKVELYKLYINNFLTYDEAKQLIGDEWEQVSSLAVDFPSGGGSPSL